MFDLVENARLRVHATQVLKFKGDISLAASQDDKFLLCERYLNHEWFFLVFLSFKNKIWKFFLGNKEQKVIFPFVSRPGSMWRTLWFCTFVLLHVRSVALVKLDGAWKIGCNDIEFVQACTILWHHEITILSTKQKFDINPSNIYLFNLPNMYFKSMTLSDVFIVYFEHILDLFLVFLLLTLNR